MQSYVHGGIKRSRAAWWSRAWRLAACRPAGAFFSVLLACSVPGCTTFSIAFFPQSHKKTHRLGKGATPKVLRVNGCDSPRVRPPVTLLSIANEWIWMYCPLQCHRAFEVLNVDMNNERQTMRRVWFFMSCHSPEIFNRLVLGDYGWWGDPLFYMWSIM